MSTIAISNREVIKLIGQSSSPTILGLLPVEIEMQESCLQEVKEFATGEFRRVRMAFNHFPAATAYAIAISLGKGVTDRAIYPPLQEQLGLELSGPERSSLSALFTTACQRLGLVMATDEDIESDVNLRPFIFQAGILPRWVPHLGDAVLSYLNRNACPDLEDDAQIARFSEMLANRVPQGEARLRRTLNSSAGPVVGKAILAAFKTKDFDRLPPHLREPMREVRLTTGGDSIRSPFLRFRKESGELVLVLPRQSLKLADYRPIWLLNTNNVNALVEREVSVEDLGEDGVTIQLRFSGSRFQDQSFTVKLAPDDNEPFFIFRAADGRRIHLADRCNIELPLGDYDLVCGAGVTTNEDSEFRQIGNYRTSRVEVFPGRSALEIATANKNIRILPRLGADLLVQDGADNKLGTVEGETIFYGDTLEIHAYLPTGDADTPEQMEFRIECPDNSGISPLSFSAKDPSTRGAYDFYDLTGTLARPFLTSLPAGIYEIQISAEGRSRSFNRKLLYWKGFKNTGAVFGFRCEQPGNFDRTNSAGLVSTAEGLRLSSDHIGAEARLAINRPNRVFTLAKPGLWLSFLDTDLHEVRALELGRSIEINPGTRQSLVIESGDLLPWRIECNGVVLATLKPGHPKVVLNLNSLLAQFGETGSLQATNLSNAPRELVRFSKANLLRDLKVECPAGSLTYAASFRLSQSQVGAIEATFLNFAEPTPTPGRQEIVLTAGVIPATDLGEPASWQIAEEDTDWVIKLEASLPALPKGIHFVDLRGCRNEGDAWQPLKVADMHGLSESRLVLLGPAWPEATAPWTQLITSVSGAFQNGSSMNLRWLRLSDEEMAAALARLQEAVLFKYASAVWSGVKWLENTVAGLCQELFETHSDGIAKAFAMSAVSGLERRGEAGLNINSILLFGSQSKLLSINGKAFCSIGEPKTLTSKIFLQIGRIASASTLKDFMWSGGQLGNDFLTSFENFPQVAGNAASEFKGFNYPQHFSHLSAKVQELEFQQAHNPDETLLSAEHFLSAIRALNRRFRPLEQVRSLDQPTSSLAHMMGDIQAIRSQFDQVAMSMKEKLSIPSYVDFGIPIPIAESELVQAVSDILLLVTGLARLNAAGILSREKYKNSLNALIAPGENRPEKRIRRLCLLMSLAPELFAFYMLYWEASLKPLVRR